MAWLTKLATWFKMWFAYTNGKSTQSETDHSQAVQSADLIGQKIVIAQSEAGPADNADLAKRLRSDGGL